MLILISLRSYFPLPFSIIDGRYNEQKHRLQECGLRNCVYIVEGLSLSGEWSRVEWTRIEWSGLENRKVE